MTSDSTSLYGNPANGVITRRAVQYFGLAPSLPLLGSSYLEGTALLASIGSCGGAWILSLTRSFSWSSYNLANAFFISRLMLLTPLWLTLARRSPRIAPISSISTKGVFTDVGSLGLWTFYRTPSALHPLWVHLLHCLLRRLIVPPSGRVCGECFWRASRIRALASGLAEDGFPHMWLPPGVLIFFSDIPVRWCLFFTSCQVFGFTPFARWSLCCRPLRLRRNTILQYYSASPALCGSVSGILWDVAKNIRHQPVSVCYDRWTDFLAGSATCACGLMQPTSTARQGCFSRLPADLRDQLTFPATMCGGSHDAKSNKKVFGRWTWQRFFCQTSRN